MKRPNILANLANDIIMINSGFTCQTKWSEWVNVFNVVYQQFISMYESACQICCNRSRLESGFNLPAHRTTMPQINMIPYPVTLNRHWVNQPCFISYKWWTLTREATGANLFSLYLDPTPGEPPTFRPWSERSTHYDTEAGSPAITFLWDTHVQIKWSRDFTRL